MIEIIGAITLVLLDVFLLQKIAEHMRLRHDRKKQEAEDLVHQYPPSVLYGKEM
tara:strand:- start:166 stop:327 length:162 start_codon:yes stop_codon:yes gene_type:complete